jgi:hypothetical protein
MSKLTRAPIALVALLATCSTTGTRRPKPGSREDAQHALVDLQRGEFAAAEDAARELLERDEHNPYGNVVAALTLYKRTVHDVTIDAASVIGGAVLMGGINHRYIDFALRSAAERLDRVAEHLSRASADASFSMELCLACWKTDWNRDGRINERDSLILQVEYDEHGDRLARHDPRRRPTFHFDIGDIFWARAMVDFQRAAVAIASAYDYRQLDTMFARWGRETQVEEAVIPLRNREAVLRAKALLLSGLDHADRARREYLAETDDEGEWLPNPTQKNHPLPLPVDEVLYETWESVIRDVRNLITGNEGLSVTAMAQLGDHQWENPPGGYVNVGRLLERPGPIVINRSHLEAVDHYSDRAREDVEATLEDFLGDKYVSQMKPSPLVDTLARIRDEVDTGKESVERKLKYFLWLN